MNSVIMKNAENIVHPSETMRSFAAGMSADRALEPARVVGEEEVVVAPGVGTELRVVTVRREGQGGTALPPADHLRPEEVLVLPVRRPLP